MSGELLALSGLRVVAVTLAALALVQALCNVLETLTDIDVAHLGYYLRGQLLRPGVLLLVAALLWTLAPALAAAMLPAP